MKHKSIVIGLAIMASCMLAHAQTPISKSITLQQAIDSSLKYNKQLKINQTRILAATADIREAKDRRLPDAGISGSFLYLPLDPGIDLKTSGTGSNMPAVHEALYGMASVSLPLFTGGKLKYGVESANLLEQAVKLDVDQDRSLVLLNTINACINLYKAHQAITLVKENLEQAKQRVKDLSNLEKNGLLARNDLLKAELQSSNTELLLLDAENNYAIACVNMNLMMGQPEQTLLIPDRSGLALPDSIKTLDAYEQDALQNRKDKASLLIRKQVAQLGIKSAKADYLPSLALTGGYFAADIPKFITITHAVNFGLSVKYNIASLWKTKTKIQQATYKLQQVELNEGILDDQVRLQINTAYQGYLLSRKKIEVMLKSVLQATENYRITKNKYDNSLATTTDLLDADAALLQANLSVTNAKADSFLAYNKLLQTAGLLTR